MWRCAERRSVKLGRVQQIAGISLFSALFISPASSGTAFDPPLFSIHPVSFHYVAPTGDDGGPGTKERPWATINHAANQAQAGDTIIIRAGHYVLPAQVRVRSSGEPEAWINFVGAPGETAILDADELPHDSLAVSGLDNGAFQIERVNYIRVINLTVIHSHDASFTIRDASNVDLINNTSDSSYSSGIAVWDTNHLGNATHYIRILGNTITRANLGGSPGHEAPHEAISIGGAVDFEVAYNRVENCAKEGIDLKETSKDGDVHHNVVNNSARQGIYIDAWFGELSGIKIYSNIVYRDMAGVALSVENGERVRNVKIDQNIIFNNAGSGLYFSRWGRNGEREGIKIYNNTFYHNGCAEPAKGQNYFWMTGGLYLYSTRLQDISISDNAFSENCGFQIGYSEVYLKNGQSWAAVAKTKNIKIAGNIIDGPNDVSVPIRSGGADVDQVQIYAVVGKNALRFRPEFKDPANEDFAISKGGAPEKGAYIATSTRWWARAFPPMLFTVGEANPR